MKSLVNFPGINVYIKTLAVEVFGDLTLDPLTTTFSGMNASKFNIGNRLIGEGCLPLVVAEIGINHGGSFSKAVDMIDAARNAGAECVKFQSHDLEDEMTDEAKHVIPGNTSRSIYDVIESCLLSEKQEEELKLYTEDQGLIFLSTPFSRKSANRLNDLGVAAFKIGSGECNNYPLISHIARFGKPIILSTGMNDLNSVKRAVDVICEAKIPYALLHCTSLYPTPYKFVRLGAMEILQKQYPDAVVGLSDHSKGNYTCFASIALGAKIVEKHITADKGWDGPDINISLDPTELKDLIVGVKAIHESLGGEKLILHEENVTSRFAYSSVVSICRIRRGESLSYDNIWVKRPGTGEIQAKDFDTLLGAKAIVDIAANSTLRWDQIQLNK